MQHPNFPHLVRYTERSASATGQPPPGRLGLFDEPTRPSIQGLKNLPILLVEDEVLVSMDIEFALADAGAQVVGPAGSLEAAIDVFEAHPEIAGAILDVSLIGEDVYPLAIQLSSKSIPIVFHTGHAVEDALLAQFPDAAVCVKPVPAEKLLAELGALLKTRQS